MGETGRGRFGKNQMKFLIQHMVRNPRQREKNEGKAIMEHKEAENFPELMKKFLELLESRNKIVLHKQIKRSW